MWVGFIHGRFEITLPCLCLEYNEEGNEKQQSGHYVLVVCMLVLESAHISTMIYKFSSLLLL